MNDTWATMLDPPDRLEPTLLLDVILVNQFHQRGVDYLYLESEKGVPGGVVRMTVYFDREDPESDVFAVAILDAHGREIRDEEYSFDDVSECARFLQRAVPPPEELEQSDGWADLDDQRREELFRHSEAWHARMQEITAVTGTDPSALSSAAEPHPECEDSP